MATLARDIDAYNRALQAYQRRAGSYNSNVKKYNASIMKDPSGNPYVYGGTYDPFATVGGAFYTADKTSGRLTGVDAPAGYAGMTQIPDSPEFAMLRQNPTGKEVVTFTGATKVEGGVDENGNAYPAYFYVKGQPDAEGSTQRVLDASKARVISQTPGGGDPNSDSGYTPPTYTIEYDINSFSSKPGEFTETFDKKAPDPTKAQIDQANRLSPAQQEMGLIGEVLRSRGLKTGIKGLIRKKIEEEKKEEEETVLAKEEPTTTFENAS
jgi:hypothetical protein